MHVTPRPVLSGEEQARLRKHEARAVTTRRLVERCQIVLRATEGTTDEQIAAALGIARHRVCSPLHTGQRLVAQHGGAFFS